MSITTSPDFMEGFSLCEPERPEIVDHKVGQLALGHILVSDFDLTLTTNGHTEEDVDTSSWGFCARSCPSMPATPMTLSTGSSVQGNEMTHSLKQIRNIGGMPL